MIRFLSKCILTLIIFVSCHDNRKLPEGRFALFGPLDSWMTHDAWMGLLDLKELRYSEINKWERPLGMGINRTILRKEIERGASLVWLFDQVVDQKTVDQLIQQYPHQKFAIISKQPLRHSENTQVANIFYRVEEGAYLAGYMAAKMSKQGYLGVVSVAGSADSTAYVYGFFAGAVAGRKDIKLSHVEVFKNSYDYEVQQSALQLYNAGVDIVFIPLEEGVETVLNLALKKNFFVITAQKQIAPKYSTVLLTSVIKEIDMTVFRVSNDVLNKVFPGGEAVTFGLAEGLVGLTKKSHSHVPLELRYEVEALVPSIILNEIRVPSSPIEFENFGYKLRLDPLKKS